MPQAAKKTDPLSLLGDGVLAKSSGRSWPIPLAATEIAVEIVGGLAIVRTERRFRNAEDKPIEATMTFPVPGEAALTGLRATIDGRELVATAQASEQARGTYEAALDEGKTAILHEEKLRGVHMLSLGNLAPGKEAAVTVTFVAPLSFATEVPTLRIPTSVAEIFGRSPLIPSDDIVAGGVTLSAKVRVGGHGGPLILGAGLAEAELPLDGAIVLAVPAWAPEPARGRAADGADVTVSVDRLASGDAPLDLTVVFDRSGSTGEEILTDGGSITTWEAMARGLRHALGRALRPGDRLRIYDYGSDVHFVGEAEGPGAVRLVEGIQGPSGGTHTGLALAKAMAGHAGDVLLFTDGRSHAVDVGRLAAQGRRISAVLVGTGALDAHVGNLAALTGGQLFVVPADQADAAALAALGSLRFPAAAEPSPRREALPNAYRALRGGAEIALAWGEPAHGESADDIGRYAAALALPALTDAAATRVAVEHGLCTHLTSLVMVDEAGELQQGIPASRKVPLMAAAGAGAFRSFGAERYGAAPGGMMRASGLVRSGLASSLGSEMRKGGSGMLRSAAPRAQPDAGSRSWTLDQQDFGGRRTRGGGPRPDTDLPPAPAPLPSARAYPLDLAGEAGRIDWDTLAAAAEASGLDALPPAVRVTLLRVAALAPVAALAVALGREAQTVALGLLAAAATTSRPAGRLARRLLAGAPEAELKAARAAVGL